MLPATTTNLWQVQSWRRACAWNADHPRAKELFDRYKLPAFHDPFAGGGSLPLEAQRLGLDAAMSWSCYDPVVTAGGDHLHCGSHDGHDHDGHDHGAGDHEAQDHEGKDHGGHSAGGHGHDHGPLDTVWYRSAKGRILLATGAVLDLNISPEALTPRQTLSQMRAAGLAARGRK